MNTPPPLATVPVPQSVPARMLTAPVKAMLALPVRQTLDDGAVWLNTLPVMLDPGCMLTLPWLMKGTEPRSSCEPSVIVMMPWLIAFTAHEKKTNQHRPKCSQKVRGLRPDP